MLSLENLTITRGDTILVSDLTQNIVAGTTWILTGPNGSGKTSFLRALAELLIPAAGTIKKPDFLWISAQPIPPSLETPKEYLAFHAALLNTTLPMIDPFGIETISKTPFNRLSTGQRQRVKLSRLLQVEKPLWLLDEPSDGLDAQGIQTLQYLITQHTKNDGIVVIATHQPHLWPDATTLNFKEAS